MILRQPDFNSKMNALALWYMDNNNHAVYEIYACVQAMAFFYNGALYKLLFELNWISHTSIYTFKFQPYDYHCENVSSIECNDAIPKKFINIANRIVYICITEQMKHLTFINKLSFMQIQITLRIYAFAQFKNKGTTYFLTYFVLHSENDLIR